MPDHSEVTIGLPVYEGQAYVASAIESVLAQTFERWRLIVSDNASSDHTAAIVQAFADRDPRVRLVRHEVNRGAAWNFNFVLADAPTPYVQWLSHDDLLAPQYLERCVAALEADPDVVLAHTRVRVIGPDGAPVGDMTQALDRGDAPSPPARFHQVVMADRWCYEVFGVMRTEAFRKTPGLAPHIASDRSLLAELALRGRFRQVPESLFLSRDHPGRSVRAYPAHHLRSAWFDPKSQGARVFPHWRILGEYLRCIERVALPKGQRMRCRLSLVRWVTSSLNWARLLVDPILAVWPGAWKVMDSLSGASRRWIGIARE